MATAPTAPSTVPEFPALGDSAFNTKAYTWAQHMGGTFPAEMAALAGNAYANTGEAVSSAADAAATAASMTASLDAAVATATASASASATAAAGSADDAAATAASVSSSLAAAVSSATASATASAATAEAAAASAEMTAGASAWVSGTTYTVGDTVWSPINFQTYRRSVSGAGTTDPSADEVNWVALTAAGGGGGGTELVLTDAGVPATPATGDLTVFTEPVAGFPVLKTIDPLGRIAELQSALFRKSAVIYVPCMPVGTTTGTGWGGDFRSAVSGTGAAVSNPPSDVNSSNFIGSIPGTGINAGSSTTGYATLYNYNRVALIGAVGIGGFFFSSRFGAWGLSTGDRIAVGLCRTYTSTSNPSAIASSKVMLAKDAADTDWSIVTCNGSTNTKTATGCTVTVGQVLDFSFYCKSGGSQIVVRLVDAETGTVYMDDVVITATLPASTDAMRLYAHMAHTTGIYGGLSLNNMYLETAL